MVCSGDAQRVTSRVEDEVARDGVYLGFPVLKATFVVSRATKTTKHPRLSCFRSFRDKDEGRLTGSPVAYLWGEAEIFSKKTSAGFLVFSRIFIDADRFCLRHARRPAPGHRIGRQDGAHVGAHRIELNCRIEGESAVAGLCCHKLNFSYTIRILHAAA